MKSAQAHKAAAPVVTCVSPLVLTPKEARHRANIPKKKDRIKEIWPLMLLWVFMTIFTILYAVYIYKTLLSSNPRIGSLLPSASDTNLVVSILSQVLANVVDVLILGVFDVMRWQLAARFAGVSATTFFQLGSSTQWVAVFFLTITKLSGVGLGVIRSGPNIKVLLSSTDFGHQGYCYPFSGSTSGPF
jgi:hypothetical protein